MIFGMVPVIIQIREVVFVNARVREELNSICGIICKTVETQKIYLFGSYAYGQPSEESDYDLCVIIPDGSVRPVDAIKDIRRALYPIQSMPLDVIVCSEQNFSAKSSQATLERKIAREGVLLYEQERPLL